MIIESEQEALKREQLERWRARRPRLRKVALQILHGRRGMDPSWPAYIVRDVETEIAEITKERDDADRIEKAKRRRIEAERADKGWLL